MYMPYFYSRSYYFPLPCSYPYSSYYIQRYIGNQVYFIPYIAYPYVSRNSLSSFDDIVSKHEYIQYPPRYSPTVKDVTLDKESLKKIINKCGRHGMWIFVTLNTLDSSGRHIQYPLNVRSFENDILSGYKVPESWKSWAYPGEDIKNLSIPIQDIIYLECYNPSLDSKDSKFDVNIISPPCEEKITIFHTKYLQGNLYGKSYIDIGKGIIIYYEVYQCGVYTSIFINGNSKLESFMHRYEKAPTHSYMHYEPPNSSVEIVLDMSKKESEIARRLNINIIERVSTITGTTASGVIDSIVDKRSWRIKVPFK